MNKPHHIKFFGGLFDGIELEVPSCVEKVAIQLASGKVLRYEHDQIEDYDSHTMGRMVECHLSDKEFDDEMDFDEKRRD